MEEKNRPESMDEKTTTVLEENLATCQQELAEWKDKCLRTAADLQNYIRRTEKDRERWTEQITAEILLSFLVLADDIDRALEEAEKKESSAQDRSWLDGFTLIQKKLYNSLEQFGVKPIIHYTIFDPELHEAIAQVPSTAHEAGAIIDIHKKGFMIGDRVLRPAQVTVAVESN